MNRGGRNGNEPSAGIWAFHINADYSIAAMYYGFRCCFVVVLPLMGLLTGFGRSIPVVMLLALVSASDLVLEHGGAYNLGNYDGIWILNLGNANTFSRGEHRISPVVVSWWGIH